MMSKQYLKMADVFPFDVGFNSDGGIGAVVDSQGEYIAQAMENNYCSHMSNKDKNEYRNKVARYVAHSVASHDELVAEVERLREFERDAMRYRLLRDNCTIQQADSHGPVFVMTIRQKNNQFNVGLSIDEAMNA